MQNYFNYFTEIEERFQQRRGSLLMLSTLDWALIETWREAGVPLEAVLRGIDNAFDKHDAKVSRAKVRVRRVNGLAWCAQSVLEAVEEIQDAATGSAGAADVPAAAVESGFEGERVARYLEENAAKLEAAGLPRLRPRWRARSLSGCVPLPLRPEPRGEGARLRSLTGR